MAEINVVAAGGDVYQVTVEEGEGSTTHEVTAPPDEVARLGEGASAEELVDASFRFLLDREPKESILPRFELTVITRYFPEYPSRLADYL